MCAFSVMQQCQKASNDEPDHPMAASLSDDGRGARGSVRDDRVSVGACKQSG
jgi:hypothetical protein